MYLAGELLRADGFPDVQYVQGDNGVSDSSQWVARGEMDFDFNMPSMHAASIDAGVPIKVPSGAHLCLELRANDSVNSISDLKGKRVGILGNEYAPASAFQPHGQLCRPRSCPRY